MGVAHLMGKRTGRPKGSRTMPPWRRDALWAYRQLCREGAANGGVNGGDGCKPPTPFAASLLALGREHPDRLAAVLIQMDGPAPVVQLVQEKPRAGPCRVKTLTLMPYQWKEWVLGSHSAWMEKIPEGVEVVGPVKWFPRGKKMVLTLRHESFEPVPEGAPVPEIKLGF
jgi:hypothetical protein